MYELNSRVPIKIYINNIAYEWMVIANVYPMKNMSIKLFQNNDLPEMTFDISR